MSFDLMAGQRVLVTGGTGMIGRQLVGLLLEAGAHVTTVSLEEGSAMHLRGDLRDMALCRQVVKDQDYVFHLAGLKGSFQDTATRPVDYLVPMLQMDSNILLACHEARVPFVVYTSSIGAYSQSPLRLTPLLSWNDAPMDQWPGWAKRMGELQIHAYRSQYTAHCWRAVRLANVYGPGVTLSESGMVVGALLWKALHTSGTVEVIGDGSPVRDFIYSRDAAEGILRVAAHDSRNGQLEDDSITGPPGVVNIGSGEGIPIRQLVKVLQEVTGREFMFKPGPQGYAMRVLDTERTRMCLKWAPSTSLKEGLEATWDWAQTQKEDSR